MFTRPGPGSATLRRLDVEAEVLLNEFGVGAYSEARRREREASSDAIAADWSGVASKVAQLAAGLIDDVDPPMAASPPVEASQDREASPLARTQPYRIQFVRFSPRREISILDEVLIEASDTSAAIIAAACAAWPPHTRELRIIDRTGRQVFERKAGARRSLAPELLGRGLPGA